MSIEKRKGKLKLYSVTRYNALHPRVYALAPTKKVAIDLANEEYGKADSDAKLVSWKIPKVLTQIFVGDIKQRK